MRFQWDFYDYIIGMETELLYLENLNHPSPIGYVVGFSESRIEWGPIEMAKKMTESEVEEFVKNYSGSDAICSVVVD